MQELWAIFLEFLRWVQSLLTVADLTYLIALLGFLAAAAPYYKKVAAFMYKHTLEPIGKFFSTFATLPDRLSALEEKINGHEEVKKRLVKLEEVNVEIKKELTPNGGSSIKDVVEKMAKGMEKLTSSIDNLTVQGTRMELRQKSILNSVDIPTFERDAQGNCLYANKAYLDLAGRTMEEVKGLGWLNIVHPDDRKRVHEQWLSATTQDRDFELTFRIINKQDHMVYQVEVMAESVSGNGYIGKYESVTPLGYENARLPAVT